MNAATHVIVGCKLPNGLHLELKGNSGDAQRVTINGANSKRIIGGYGLTHEVPAEFMNEWLKKNKKHPAVLNGSIFIHTDTASAESAAKERSKELTGLEGIDPIANGMLKGANGETDREALKAYEIQRNTNPARNLQVQE